MSDKKDTPAALCDRTDPSGNSSVTVPHGYSHELSIKNSVREIAIPEFSHRVKELSEGIVSRTEDSRRVLPDEVSRPNFFNSSDVLEHEARLAIKALSSSGD